MRSGSQTSPNNSALEALERVIERQAQQIDKLLDTITQLNSALADAIKPQVVQYEPSSTPLWYTEEEEEAKWQAERKDSLQSQLAELGLDTNIQVQY